MYNKDWGIKLREGLLTPNMASLLANLSTLQSRMSECVWIFGNMKGDGCIWSIVCMSNLTKVVVD